MSRRVKIGLLAAVVAMMVAIAGCGDDEGSSTSSSASQTSEAKQYTIGFIGAGRDVTFWNDIAHGAETADTELENVKVDLATLTSGFKPEEFIPIVQNMLTKKVDALVVPGIPQLLPMFKRVQAANIPIVFYADGLPDQPGLAKSTVITDNKEGGRKAGEYMKEALGGKGTVTVVQMSRGTYVPLDERVDGFKGALEGTDIKLNYVTPDCLSEEPSIGATQNALTRNPDLTGIFSQCGLNAHSVNAVLERSKIDRDAFVHVGYDADEAIVQSIIDGWQDAAIAQFPVKMGKVAVETAYKVLEGESVPETIDPGTMLITKDNAAKELKNRR